MIIKSARSLVAHYVNSLHSLLDSCFCFLFPRGCSELPSLESDPPQTCFVGDNVTLTCRVTESTPAARLSWLRDISQPEAEIQPGGRFLITQEGNVSRLTIQNCSQGTDGGCYVCKAQNPVGLRELFVCLTVKGEWGCGRRSTQHTCSLACNEDSSPLCVLSLQSQ